MKILRTSINTTAYLFNNLQNVTYKLFCSYVGNACSNSENPNCQTNLTVIENKNYTRNLYLIKMSSSGQRKIICSKFIHNQLIVNKK